jgi:predicted adenylyl cyclase CyaB
MNEILNVEIKSRCKNQNEIEKILNDLGAVYKGVDHQVDTYFLSKKGRLKLRQGSIENSLIYYDRSNKAESRESFILLEKLPKETNLLGILTESVGVKIVVDKLRKIFFIDNVKFHVDEVQGLGQFVEIEAICTDGTKNNDDLKIQCNHYIAELKLQKKDFVELSYSDMVNEDFEDKINREATKFLTSLFFNLESTSVNVEKMELDHLCYRVSSEKDYAEYKQLFSQIGELLIESQVGGRPIATYKLNHPITWNNNRIQVIELPSPKISNKYSTGFEHAEFVMKDSFDEFMKCHPSLVFDLTAMAKDINPDIRLGFKSGESVKFHHQTLAQVIEYEKSID